MIKYEKFFILLKNKGIKQIDLRAKGIHPRTFQKLAKNKHLRSDTFNELCKFLDCQPGDIMEYVADDEQKAGEQT